MLTWGLTFSAHFRAGVQTQTVYVVLSSLSLPVHVHLPFTVVCPALSPLAAPLWLLPEGHTSHLQLSQLLCCPPPRLLQKGLVSTMSCVNFPSAPVEWTVLSSTPLQPLLDPRHRDT